MFFQPALSMRGTAAEQNRTSLLLSVLGDNVEFKLHTQ